MRASDATRVGNNRPRGVARSSTRLPVSAAAILLPVHSRSLTFRKNVLRRLWLPALIALPLGVAAQAVPPLSEVLQGIAAEQIRAHLVFLADDATEGRAPGTRGATISANYIASQLARAGIEPAIRGSYFQPVPLIGWRPDVRGMQADFAAATRRTQLQYGTDAVMWLDSGEDTASVRGEVVFVGYGTRAPEYQWDDYKGRDVRGRIVVVLSSDPPAPPTQMEFFDGGALTYYGRYTYKIEEAARQGAAAVLIVHTTDGAGYPWRTVQSSWGVEQLALPRDSTPALSLQGWLTFEAARRVLASAGHDLNELFVRAARRDFQPVFTGITATLRATGRTRRFESMNVVGIVPGRHAARRNEAVVYTAHYDHLGIGAPVAGDSIYNGAYDNASGVALLLDIAEAFAQVAPRAERSVVFVFTTAEEAVMLGATHYVRNPVVPVSRTLAAFNIDGANVWGATTDVGAVGLERSTLGATFETHAQALGLRVHTERAPEQGFFFRSDQFAFARAGVPALFLDHGVQFRDRPAGWGSAVLSRYEAERYHQPGDNYDPSFDLAGAAQQGQHAFLVGYDIANTSERPRWYQGGQIRPR
jgi:Zn-dependent M28 family amino/carboxypeptidase